MSQCCNKFIFDDTPDTFQMWQGLRGPYFTPHVAENGDLSWSNNGQLPNPETVNIKGPPGPGGVPGGTTGQLLAKASDEDYDTEWIDPPDLDAGHVEYDPAETYDDGSVGKELTTINSALSSLSSVTEIIDTASGAIASFPDGAGLPMRSLLAQINPVQDLHGYDAPYPAGGGKNKANLTNPQLTTNTTQTVATLNLTGTYTIVFSCDLENANYETASAGVVNLVANGSNNYITPGLFYRVSDDASITSLTRPVTGRFYAKWTSVTNPEQVVLYFMSSSYGKWSGQMKNVQVEISETPTDFSPYSNICPISGHTGLSVFCEEQYDQSASPKATVSWQDEAGTVYGGSDEVVGGNLTSTMGIITLDGTQSISIVNWRASSTSVGWVYPYSLTNNKVEIVDSNIPNVVCDSLPTITYANAFSMSKDVGITTLASSTGASSYGLVVRINDPTLTTASAINAYLSAHPITVVYELATPQSFTHDPQEVDTLLGQNNVWHDANGDTTVTYQASIKGYIDKVLGS